jgi:cardiolipin synthase
VLYVLAIASALEAILRARTAQGAIAWVVSLLTLPYVTVPLYLVLGRNRFEGYIREREQIEAQAQARLRDTRSELFDFKARGCRGGLLPRPATPGTPADGARQPGRTADRRLRHLRQHRGGSAQAEHYILFQFYILRDDALGRRLGAILAEKARAGCACMCSTTR